MAMTLNIHGWMSIRLATLACGAGISTATLLGGRMGASCYGVLAVLRCMGCISALYM